MTHNAFRTPTFNSAAELLTYCEEHCSHLTAEDESAIRAFLKDGNLLGSDKDALIELLANTAFPLSDAQDFNGTLRVFRILVDVTGLVSHFPENSQAHSFLLTVGVSLAIDARAARRDDVVLSLIDELARADANLSGVDAELSN